jgi:hypothetical protein
MEVAAMAIHAPAHRPGVHFNVGWPHLGRTTSDLLEATAIFVVTLAIVSVAMAVIAPNGISGARATAGYDSATSMAAYDGSAAMNALLIRTGPAATEAQRLARFRASEHASYVPPPTALQDAWFRLEEHGYSMSPTALQDARFRLEEHGY